MNFLLKGALKIIVESCMKIKAPVNNGSLGTMGVVHTNVSTMSDVISQLVASCRLYFTIIFSTNAT
jgi:hypothetical protein